MPARTLQANSGSTFAELPLNLLRIFDQAQVSSANHQKNVVALYKLHSEAARHTESLHNGKSIKLTGERIFEELFMHMVSRALLVKKGTTQADRIIKFVGGYTKFINEKGQ
jgi:condensin complex subunit 3